MTGRKVSHIRKDSLLRIYAEESFDQLMNSHLVEWFIGDGIDITLKWSTKSRHHFVMPGSCGKKYEIILSASALRWEKKNGQLEWCRVATKILKDTDLRSIKGNINAKWTIAHEFAHILQAEWQKKNDRRSDRYGRIKGSIHNDCFIGFFKKTVLALELADPSQLVIVQY